MLKADWPAVAWHLADQKQPHEAKLLQLDSDKARRELAWQPVWTLEEGVAATAEWYRAWLDRGGLISREQLQRYIQLARDRGLFMGQGPRGMNISHRQHCRGLDRRKQPASRPPRRIFAAVLRRGGEIDPGPEIHRSDQSFTHPRGRSRPWPALPAPAQRGDEDRALPSRPRPRRGRRSAQGLADIPEMDQPLN
jgi:hypothetical protein